MNIRDFYDRIAESWYNVRHWTILRDELEKLNTNWPGGKLLNIGCAHGADFVPFDSKRFKFYGVDLSKNLLFLARKYENKFGMKFHLVVSNMLSLPFKNSSFDYIICIATLHHLLERNERISALKEMKRVLKEDGEAFLTVWNRDNPELPDQEVYEREWKFSGEVLKREYYLYTKEELEKDIIDAGFKVKKIYTDREEKNIIALMRRIEI
ncbi:MAG: class I SAM-dependent methyltransferase [Candidatus Aenigmarchaeota archaeon]|nr:class I SAM-dependent methyltransferase [Candidatus Aenigmarchaeota archaeon]